MQLERFLEHYPKRADPGLPAVRASPSADGDAAPDLRVHRRRPRLHPPALRAGAPPDLAARPARPGSRCRLEKLGPHAAAGGCFPANFWLVLDDRLPLRRAIKRPDVRASLPPETLAELRADAERLRELTGRDFSNWKIWDLAGPRWPSQGTDSKAKQKHKHPGGAGAVLGVRVMRNSSVQGAHAGDRQRHAARLDAGRRVVPRAERAGAVRPADVPGRPRHPAHLAALQARNGAPDVRRRRRR